MNRRHLQWVIIWVSTLTAAHVWLGLSLSDWWPKDGASWGLFAYLNPALTYHRSEFAFVILAAGALLSWQLSARYGMAEGKPAGPITAGVFSTRRLLIACLVALFLLLGLQLASLSQSRRPAGSSDFSSYGRW
jgi:hypothetical protein